MSLEQESRFPDLMPKPTAPTHGPVPAQVDIIIVGGGIIGMSLAVALADAGFHLALIDREPPPIQAAAAFDGRASAVALGSRRILDTLGLWNAIEPESGPILDIRVTDGPSRLFLHYDHRDAGETTPTGDPAPLGSIVENQTLRRVLFAAVADRPEIAWITPATVASISVEGAAATVTLASGGSCRAALVIGCDGRGSMVRRAAGILGVAWDYPQTAIVTAVSHEEPHRGIAHERFLPVGPFALLPLRDPRASSVVWTERRDRVAKYLALTDAELGAEMTDRFGPSLGRLTVTRQRWTWPLKLHHAARYVAPRIALAGDAAHGIHPIAGQGLNLGWRDVAALAEVLVDARRLGRDIGDVGVLKRYEDWRRPDVLSLVVATDALNRLFSTSLPPIRMARDLGLAMVDRMPIIKRALMRQAMGIGGRMPRLARGEAL